MTLDLFAVLLGGAVALLPVFAKDVLDVGPTGLGILLIDHDMALVLGICDDVYVLDLGREIAHGDPATIRADRAVTAAYLGSAHDHVPEAI